MGIRGCGELPFSLSERKSFYEHFCGFSQSYSSMENDLADGLRRGGKHSHCLRLCRAELGWANHKFPPPPPRKPASF